MATGDSPEMQRMQEEAIRRAREMSKRSQPSAEEESPEAKSGSKAKGRSAARSSSVKNKEEKTENIAERPKKPEQEAMNPVGSVLDSLFKDKDQTLILMLLILIGGEKENHELMFALLYLLM